MKINKQIIEKFRKTESKILAVIKYFDPEITKKLLSDIDKNYSDIIIWVWENRLESLKEKNLPREATHFIWNLQTKQLKHIIDHCDTIHSLDSMKHARKLNDLCESKNTWIKVFIQINLDETKPGGIRWEDLWKFLIDIFRHFLIKNFNKIN